MKIVNLLRGIAVAAAALGMFNTNAAMAADGQADVIVTDVALQDGGVLLGQVLDTQGAAQPASDVVVMFEGFKVATVKTDEDGRFAVSGLRGGVHAIQTEQGNGAYRLWAPKTAPPAASGRVLVVNDGLTQRAQLYNVLYPGPFVQGMVVGGLLTGGVYAAIDHNPSGS